ncbi:hypothetical protein FQR65_LT17847 [Abscondita terminalis]|nr:hypothetical protein FQR65_LT17847 [Abscondita terminalis]
MLKYILAAITVVMRFMAHISAMEWIAVCLCIGLVIAMEALNTAIEHMADMITLDQHPGIKRIKDVAAGAGKTVKKVLLDGEEFFGDDPTFDYEEHPFRICVFRKVQVYEKKSEMATRTGVDDGERTQTIDIRLKEESKRGVFGDLNAGIGSKGFYSGSLTLNKFKGLQKIGVFGNQEMNVQWIWGIFSESEFWRKYHWQGASNGYTNSHNSGITFSD